MGEELEASGQPGAVDEKVEEGVGQEQKTVDDGAATSKTVPLERLTTVSRQNQELRKQLQEINERVELLQKPHEERVQLEEKKRASEDFYKDPHGFLERRLKQIQEEHQKSQAEIQDMQDYQTSMSQLKSSPDFNEEIENAMVRVIRAYGFQKLGRAAALKAAYETATGKEWGKWGDSGYSIRKTKERLGRPSSTGGPGRGGMSAEQFAKLSHEDLAKDPEKYIKARMAFESEA